MQYILNWVKNSAIVICMFGGAVFAADALRLQRDGPVARDYINKLEWMRCSVGQHWEKETCVGEVLMLSVPEAQHACWRMRPFAQGLRRATWACCSHISLGAQRVVWLATDHACPCLFPEGLASRGQLAQTAKPAAG